ncbi:MAG: hypothetical protein IOC33_22700, partial [Burkholderia sp.]|nr:hypothetical protein [Burkholderia sp.]
MQITSDVAGPDLGTGFRTEVAIAIEVEAVKKVSSPYSNQTLHNGAEDHEEEADFG